MQQPEVHVLIERPGPRATHAVEQMLGTMLGWKVLFVPDARALQDAPGPKLVYGQLPVNGALQVRPAGLLEEQGLRAVDPGVRTVDGLPLLFPDAEGILGHDPFAAAFFLLSRMEERCGRAHDMHDRPVTSALHASRHGYLQVPVVDAWALRLARQWQAMDPALPAPVRQYRQVCTIDLDNGFKYLGRPWWRTAGSMVRDLLNGRADELGRRLAVLAGRKPDPYDIYRALRSDLGGDLRVVFFVLAATRGRWDHAVPVDHARYAERLRGLLDWAEVGLHPGYASSRTPGLTREERDRLAAILGRPVTCSRQHFLRIDLANTPAELEQLGVVEEHSLGLHDSLGFRAGTCTPYQWYDIGQERTTTLWMHPFAVMDNTLMVKLRLAPEQALDHVRPLVHAVRGVQGTFTGLWHESYLASEGGHPGWRQAILAIINEARP